LQTAPLTPQPRSRSPRDKPFYSAKPITPAPHSRARGSGRARQRSAALTLGARVTSAVA